MQGKFSKQPMASSCICQFLIKPLIVQPKFIRSKFIVSFIILALQIHMMSIDRYIRNLCKYKSILQNFKYKSLWCLGWENNRKPLRFVFSPFFYKIVNQFQKEDFQEVQCIKQLIINICQLICKIYIFNKFRIAA